MGDPHSLQYIVDEAIAIKEEIRIFEATKADKTKNPRDNQMTEKDK